MSLHLSEVLDQFLPDYQQSQTMSWQQQAVCKHIMQCRTAALGQQLWQCDSCHQQQVVYCSCRDRHCPRCQGQRTRDWLQAQSANLVQAKYFHLVFTLPHELNVLSQYAPEKLYKSLFNAVWQTLSTFAQRHRKVAGELGMTAILHTWGQTLSQHIHLHCLIPGGMLNKAERWQLISKGYLFPVKALSTVFRAKMLQQLRSEQLSIPNADALMAKPWTVFSKACLCKPQTVLSYLGRYTRKGVLHESRLQHIDTDNVSFRYRDYKDGNKHKVMILKGTEFIRRYLSHVLPKGFMRIRHYGILANRCRKQKLAIIRKQEVAANPEEKQTTSEQETPCWHCPHCRTGLLHLVSVLAQDLHRKPDS
ncbi:IS91 family transposase [Rheinheimera salexigens]|uniref:IS91 family transposase n=1 Tax=Rheinheimera salexigens TaxID=1628148 RepID=A0A1E7Q7E2_9GAMM|nr:IS91 family transposase [Rheinheimera salexigens]OEY70089.1 IS91 family transposase [Rheinheimera salexigens]